MARTTVTKMMEVLMNEDFQFPTNEHGHLDLQHTLELMMKEFCEQPRHFLNRKDQEAKDLAIPYKPHYVMVKPSGEDFAYRVSAASHDMKKQIALVLNRVNNPSLQSTSFMNIKLQDAELRATLAEYKSAKTDLKRRFDKSKMKDKARVNNENVSDMRQVLSGLLTALNVEGSDFKDALKDVVFKNNGNISPVSIGSEIEEKEYERAIEKLKNDYRGKGLTEDQLE